MFVWFCIVACASAACLVDAGMVKAGQPHQVPVNGSKVLRAAHFALVEFNKANIEEQFAYKTVKITSANIQIVSGINYILKMLLARTRCKKIFTDDGVSCVFHSEPKELQCLFVVSEIPWEGSRVLSKNKCFPYNY
ncbi:cystatin-POGU1-like [Pseudoliparis swirei]|uniref:cystatin-POGU1-like n=1 Tax=Pseudoliparis swirei TaxID=2059687 RepID=UPI0024BE53AA|nr:cystatin-POGU1-like [Pseudoliparis swirei]